jgi:2-polyprenyl-3-methyl-5-hydroxy-6-metoxy-1,4-benzoquinol methylase
MNDRRLVPTRVIRMDPAQGAVLEHERIFFPTYPWEWTPGQWRQAAAFTIDLCEEAVDSGFLLKDATPLNVLFSGASPIFVDVPSFIKRDSRNPYWLAFAQFVRTFLLPLAAFRYLGWPLSAFQQRRDGYEPADLAPWLSPRQRWFTPLRSLVTLPLLFESGLIEKRARAHSLHKIIDDEYAAVLLKHTLKNARAMLASVAPRAHASRWSRYAATATHYDIESHSAKQSFVSRILTSIRPAKVLDVGANTGVYSRIAAEAGADVVAWDTDVQAADLNWKTAMQNRLPILSVVADFARPTPSVGWNNAECANLLSRARGRFDCVLMLGVLHHLLVADQVPLAAILRQLAGISRRWAILEWIPREDTQFSSLCRGREQLYAHLTEPYFVQTLSEKFTIRSHESLPNGRTLWFVEKAA